MLLDPLVPSGRLCDGSCWWDKQSLRSTNMEGTQNLVWTCWMEPNMFTTLVWVVIYAVQFRKGGTIEIRRGNLREPSDATTETREGLVEHIWISSSFFFFVIHTVLISWMAVTCKFHMPDCQLHTHKQWTCLALLLLHFPCADCKSSPWSMSLTSSPMDVMSLWYIERERNWERREGRVSCLICCLVFEKKMMVDGFSPPNQNNCSLLAMQWPVWILPLVTVWNDNGSLLVFFLAKRFWFSPLKTDIKTEMSKSRPLVSDTVF